MKSIKYEYRLVTAWDDKISVQNRCLYYREENSEEWRGGWPDYDTKEEALALIKKLIAKDNFIPQVVEF